jgi:electron transfer flavoprotein alpha subunit
MSADAEHQKDIFVLIEHLQGQVSDISYVMLAAGRAVAEGTGGNVVALLLGHEVQGLASDLAADQLWYIDHPSLAHHTPEAYQQVVTNLIQANAPRLALFGDTSIGAEVAGQVSARLGLPLVSYCRSLHAEDGALKFVSQICGGKIMVEGTLPGPTALVTMMPGGYKPEQGHSVQPPTIVTLDAQLPGSPHVALKQYIEPESGDVDISKESLLVAVGRGIQNQDNIQLAQDLADALGGVVCSSRPVVDQGWLPTSRLVGKSGKHVKPKVYLALGISGAPEHVEAIGDSDVIIAINTDPDAPIFNLAKYGATVDLFDLAPVLTEKVLQVRATVVS